MTKKYRQLNLEQRYKIEAYLRVGKSQTAIADLLGVNRSTICRELRRNVPLRGIGAKLYVAQKAHCKAEYRHVAKAKHTKFTEELKLETKLLLEEDKYSPELVAAQWKLQSVVGVSHETIYKFIWHCKHTNQRKNACFKHLYKHLKHGKRRRKRGNYHDTRGIIPNRVSIENRPAIVEKRQRFGDTEVDLIMGKNHQSALLVIIDRATLLTRIQKLKGKNAAAITKKIIRQLLNLPPIKTMTFDNDKAFAQHEIIAKACNLKTYFTRPYTSQDKGTIENRNGVIRRFFPKKTDFNLIHHSTIKKVETKINNRPVRKFNYKTPNQVFLQLTG